MSAEATPYTDPARGAKLGWLMLETTCDDSKIIRAAISTQHHWHFNWKNKKTSATAVRIYHHPRRMATNDSAAAASNPQWSTIHGKSKLQHKRTMSAAQKTQPTATRKMAAIHTERYPAIFRFELRPTATDKSHSFMSAFQLLER
jgi:hypothetical protein